MIPFRTEAEVSAAVPDVVRHLVRHGIIGYPTETVYGLGSVASVEAVGELAQLKGRSEGKPFLLIVSDLAMLHRSQLRLTDTAARLAAAFWPGPLTLVLPGGEGVLPDAVRGPEGGIAVRWTSHAGLARLVSVLGSPITSTSANRPGQPAALDAHEVQRVFANAIERGRLVVLDAGALTASAPSTLVDCTGRTPRVLRVGALPPARLRTIVPSLAD